MSDLSVPIALLDWRDRQLEAISEQLEDALPVLVAQLEAWVDQASILDLIGANLGPNTDQKAIIDMWKSEQIRRAVRRADEAMSAALRSLPPDPGGLTDATPELGQLLPAAAGVGLLAASIAAIPTVVSFATITSSSLAIFTISTVSWPLMAVGAAGVATATFLGSTLVKRAHAGWREGIKSRLRSWAYKQMLGLGASRGARSFLSDLQAVVTLAGSNRMEQRV
ncbi:hypothetical protein [Neotabrizicola shimadae]|uniref:Uncharacterized protein n=1 Tax=Neotabrizicola shimadae TaxID=2807096 RepID=A0A8G0ZVZ4_9RHOB|nr:hypothetical protein [Neotabrizicola shimadae]QYZ71193.1 hypothetical protein JO391_06730 [Neotabrizicola shimadae]